LQLFWVIIPPTPIPDKQISFSGLTHRQEDNKTALKGEDREAATINKVLFDSYNKLQAMVFKKLG
jgi:hypothetical protein